MGKRGDWRSTNAGKRQERDDSPSVVVAEEGFGSSETEEEEVDEERFVEFRTRLQRTAVAAEEKEERSCRWAVDVEGMES